MVDHDQLVGARIRQRLQQHAFDDAEDCRVRADADRKRQHRNRGKAGKLQQPAQDLTQTHTS